MSTWVQTFTAFPCAWSESKYARFNPKPKYIKSKPSEYGSWAAKQPNNVMCHLKPSKTNPRFAVLKRPVKIFFEENEKGAMVPLAEPKVYRARFVVAIDPKSCYAGNIYNTDSKIVLYIKFFLSTIARPIHMVAKTCYHLFLIGVIKEIGKEIKQQIAEKKALEEGKVLEKEKPVDKAAGTLGQRIVRQLVDIFRTPLYETIMTIVSLTALITAPFSPGLLYDFRAFTGKLTKELFWGAKHDMPVNLTPCMYRVGSVVDLDRNSKEVADKGQNNRTLKILDHWMAQNADDIEIC